LGPWQYQGAILMSDSNRKGPGHHSFIRDASTGEWLIFYHRWENQVGDGPFRGRRQLSVERVQYDENGLIRPIVMTGERTQAQKATFTNPINPGPDPWLLFHAGSYYLTTTQGDCIRMWKAPSLEALKTAEPATLWRDNDPNRSHGIWAP